MDKDTAQRFFENRAWFNKLFHDLKVLLDKITSQIDGYDKKRFYYYKQKEVPLIVDFYSVFCTGANKLNLNISAVLDDKVVENRYILVEEPLLFIVLHTENDYPAEWITDNILKNNCLDVNEVKEEIISGVINWGKGYDKINYYSFLVPLDKFSVYSDDLAKELIVERINEVQDKYDKAL